MYSTSAYRKIEGECIRGVNAAGVEIVRIAFTQRG